MANDRLRQLRLSRGWTQADLAEHISDQVEQVTLRRPPIDSAVISKLERGLITWPNEDTRRALRAIFDVGSNAELGFYSSRTAKDAAAGATAPGDSRPPVDPTLDPQPWELVDAITRSTVSPDTVAQMERSAIAAAACYPHTPPDQLTPLIARMTSRVHQALMAPSSLRVSRRCVQLAGLLSGLAGHLNLDLGDRNQAAGFYDAGLIAAREADDDDLTAWLLTMQSIGQFFEGDPTAAVEALEEAAQLTDRGGNARRHAWVCAQLARAHAANGSPALALQRLEASASSLEGANPPSGLDFFDGARLSGIAGTCNLLIGRPDVAAEILSSALARRSRGDLKGRALLTLDLASCHVVAGEIEEACRTAESALDVASGSLVQPISIRARALKAELQPWCDLGSVRGFAERIRGDQRSATMVEG